MSKSTDSDFDYEFLGPGSLVGLNYNQQVLYEDERSHFISYLRTKAKKPKRNVGYTESNIRPVARRVHQVHQFHWENGTVVTELSTGQADDFVTALNEDEFRTRTGESYAEGSKRKFTEALKVYFQFCEKDWEPDIIFGQEETELDSDPFTQKERPQLLNASFEYQSPPNYKNLSPEERERWKGYLAQHLGKPKTSIGLDEWKNLERSWKYSSLVATALDIGPRAALIGRLSTTALDLENSQIVIPSEMAVKNNSNWECELTSRSVKMLRKWLQQRSNKKKYDNSDHLWLNRKGNPYDSGNLNNLLDNLIDIADIERGNRKLTWHSIRHSTGMYVYDEQKDLAMVANILRHKSLEAAEIYAHPTPEAKRDVLEAIQGDS